MKNRWPERHYIDLFSGAGLVKIKGTGEVIAGSPLLAAMVDVPSTALHLCERDERRLEAMRVRVTNLAPGVSARFVAGDANDVVNRLVEAVPVRALCVTFVDPYGLHFDFETAKVIAQRRSDLIVLLADNMDALRNWASYYEADESTLDRFMGEDGWRSELANATSGFPERLRNRYFERLRTLGYREFESHKVSNSRGVDIYSLIYASHSPRGLDFWRKAAAIDEGGQRSLFD